jgi:hypothetical protein
MNGRRVMVTVASALLFAVYLLGCRSTSTRDDSQAVPDVQGGVMVGRVTETTMGPLLEGNKTLLITADKGSKDGITTGTRASIRVHEAALDEFRVQVVSENSSQLLGWYYSNIRPGDTIVFNVGNLSDDKMWQYFRSNNLLPAREM